VQSRYNYASLLAKLGQVQNAINEFKKIIELQPDLLIARQNYEKLLWSQSHQVELAPNNANEFIQAHNKGLSLLEENQFAAALECFDKALIIEPTSFEGHHNKGMALEKMGRLQEAVSHYHQAIKYCPESSRTFNNLGNAYRELDLLDEAIKSLEKAIELDPNYAEAFSNLGWTLFRLQKYQQAKEYFQKAIKINPGLSPAVFNLSLCQLTLGEFDEGWIHYEERMKQPLYQKQAQGRQRCKRASSRPLATPASTAASDRPRQSGPAPIGRGFAEIQTRRATHHEQTPQHAAWLTC
jgi:tetratricopeptide (TPR) repeat protein